jgi:hypothetical protein
VESICKRYTYKSETGPPPQESDLGRRLIPGFPGVTLSSCSPFTDEKDLPRICLNKEASPWQAHAFQKVVEARV